MVACRRDDPSDGAQERGARAVTPTATEGPGGGDPASGVTLDATPPRGRAAPGAGCTPAINDGLVSMAVGAALAHGNRSFALLGDLAFPHDQNGVVIGPGGRW